MDRREFLKSASMTSLAAIVGGHAATAFIADARAAVTNMPLADIVRDERYWAAIQSAFSVSRSVINLNHAGVCPSPRVVTDGLIDIIHETEKVPPYHLFTLLNPQLETIRSLLADHMGCDAEELSLVRNTTEAMASILLGVDLKPGDEVLTTGHDYWGMLDALRQREKRYGVKMVQVPVPVKPKSMNELVEIFERGITSKTKLILVSHTVNLTGQIFPVRQICDMAHAHGIEVAVDAAQSFGLLDFNIKDLNCDYFATSLHKWMMGPKSTGLLYMKREHIAKTWAILPPPQEYENDIRKFERMGTIPAHFLALGETIAFHQGIGTKLKQERHRYLTQYWVDRVKDIPKVGFNTSFDPEMSCAITNLTIEGIEASALADYLYNTHKIYAVPITRDVRSRVDGLRVTPSLPNTLAELERFAEVIAHIARKGLPS